MTTENIIDAIKNIQIQINLRLDKLEDKMEDNMKDVVDRCLQIEKKIESGILQTSVENIQNVALITSISSSEDKIKFLNNSIEIAKQEDLIEVIKSRCVIQDNYIHSILNQEISIC